MISILTVSFQVLAVGVITTVLVSLVIYGMYWWLVIGPRLFNDYEKLVREPNLLKAIEPDIKHKITGWAILAGLATSAAFCALIWSIKIDNDLQWVDILVKTALVFGFGLSAYYWVWVIGHVRHFRKK